MPFPIISITGTKGKTTTAYVVSEALHALSRNVLRVDTTGHYVNGVQKSTLDDSKAIWKLVPTVAPGRYLWEFHADPKLRENGVAVLETALGSSSLSGLGYRVHQVGVFLNVFEDHLGSSPRIQSKEDIARAKQFIFSRIARDGTAVFNADDELVVKSLSVLPKDLGIKLLPFGFDFSQFELAQHLADGGAVITVQDDKLIYRTQDGDEVLADLKTIPWTFNGQFTPSVWNLMAAAAALHAFLGGWTPELKQAFEAVRLDPYGGRLTLLKAKNGATILADYAHEKISLAEVARLGRTLLGPKGKLIGVTRMAHDRTDELLEETGAVIGNSYDYCVIYEKIDGHFRKPKTVRSNRFPEVVGRTSEIVAKGASSVNEYVERILREDEALERAAALAGPDDVVVVIVNDDIKRSIGFIKESFKADFV